MVNIDSASSPDAPDQAGNPASEKHPSDKLVPEMRNVLDELKRLGARPLSQLSVEQARAQPGPIDAAQSLERQRGVDRTAEGNIQAKELSIPSPNGPVRVRAYIPNGQGGPFPAVLYFHSGGLSAASTLMSKPQGDWRFAPAPSFLRSTIARRLNFLSPQRTKMHGRPFSGLGSSSRRWVATRIASRWWERARAAISPQM